LVSTQPSMEVGGGLPLPVTAFYVAIGLVLSATSLSAFLELRGGS